MTTRKNNNSILLLTTLGVYLGLLVVGTAPGVLAQQAAMTRNFELSEEIENRDDLDNQPEGTLEEPSPADVAAIELIVASYLGRVIGPHASAKPDFSGSILPEYRPAVLLRPEPSDYSAFDIRRSAAFTSRQLARSAIDASDTEV